MLWVALGAVVLVVAALGAVVGVNGARFRRRVGDEAHELLRAAAAPPTRAAAELPDDLPAPVRRYLERALRGRTAPVRTVRLAHGGTLRTAPGAAWMPVHGEQYFSADPPGFVWWGRVWVAPGVWIDGRDRSVRGEGEMWITALSTRTIGLARGPELDESALHRLVGEMTWFPTAYLDERHVQWTPMDDASARLTLRVGDRQVSAVYRFGPDHLPTRFEATRHRGDGKGSSVLTPYHGTCSDYREVDGMLVPFRMVGTWMIDGQPFEYAHWEVERIEYDVAEPF